MINLSKRRSGRLRKSKNAQTIEERRENEIIINLPSRLVILKIN